ncbi:NAD(P)H-hydrate dehydratase [Pseudoflavonifractor sp. MSJ-30]|uniref:NAD(P)H-hydrate dehydratase n=1 Tax=Pseudoflavonifractor sp. MSJ-30 TaxID=2841525 RepID=UPI001C1030A7|nr:NAD(P)H-hydrate dehydratase [Pseudoflavonifractor sp. MSJ-30]MBU5452409.1 NAD(P)H-hydrate dehydratase [Pseudoflavonifractor sp. MSJ-30]
MELTMADIARLLPKRDENAHKGNFGRVLLLCGSRGYTGAAYFAAMGALRTGAGLVYLGVPESIYAIEAVKLNEPVVFPLPEQGGRLSEAAVPEILEKIPRMDAVLIGPGLGLGQGSFAVLKAVLTHAACPVVVDADGITLLVPHMDILRGREAPTILTPHDGEFTRLFGPVGEDRMASARAAALESRGIMLLKGHRTCVTDGIREYRNTTGNPGMAVGGSGDVLAGVLVSLLGQGLEPLEAAACAAWLHGKAGDLCAGELGEYGMLPTDLLDFLPRLLK